MTWDDLHDGDYKVFRTDRWLWRYDVAGPGGQLVDLCWTMAGARRAIRRDRRRMAAADSPGSPNWWDSPVVHREPATEEAPK